MDWQITNATFLWPESTRTSGGCVLSKGRFLQFLKNGEQKAQLVNLNLRGLVVIPALVNGHDSLLASFHALRPEKPCLNWLEWDNIVKSSELFRERMLLDPEQLYQLGAYRNLLSGTTVVVDHIPEFVRQPFLDRLPVWLLPEFGISHSICSYSLNWGRGVREEVEWAGKKKLPYIIHIAEGFDQESRESLGKLADLGGLGPQTVLVHGISLSASDLDRIAAAGAHLVWCPASNLRIYGKTAPIRSILERGINVCLGTDAAMYGSNNLWDDMRAAVDFYRNSYHEELSMEDLLAMVTTNASRAFQLKERGHLQEGSWADFIVLRSHSRKEALPHLLQKGLQQVYLVVRSGSPVLGDPALADLFHACGVEVDKVTKDGVSCLVKRCLRELLRTVERSTGRANAFSFLPVSV